MGLLERLQHGWNAFSKNRDPTTNYNITYNGSYYRPDRPRLSRGNEKTIVTAILNRIALDVADLDFKHIQLDEDGRYEKDIKSSLNDCLNLEANIDQSGKAFIQDITMSMFDEVVLQLFLLTLLLTLK